MSSDMLARVSEISLGQAAYDGLEVEIS